MKLVERDKKILTEIYRWRFCLRRHIMYLANFTNPRICDRRLKILVDNGYLKRKKVFYGIPYLYYISKNGQRWINENVKEENIRVDIVHHNIVMLDYLPTLMKRYNFNTDHIVTERELHQSDGFGIRNHYPDFLFKKNNEVYAVEFELTLKAKDRLLKNIENNYLNFDYQIWVVPSNQKKIVRILEECQNKFSNIEVIILK